MFPAVRPMLKVDLSFATCLYALKSVSLNLLLQARVRASLRLKSMIAYFVFPVTVISARLGSKIRVKLRKRVIEWRPKDSMTTLAFLHFSEASHVPHCAGGIGKP